MSDTTTDSTYDLSSLASSMTQCAACGSDPDKASRIHDLEAEVKRLQEDATIAATKLALYEEEIRIIKAARNDSPVDELMLQVPDIKIQQPQSAQPQSQSQSQLRPLARSTSGGGRFSFLRKNSHPQPTAATNSAGSPQATADSLATLTAALARETALREKAEKKATDTENEIEDLSATLFEQANEMVSTERKARAQLEEKVTGLEDQVATFSEKQNERTRRLDRIDEAMKRLDRVKSLLAVPSSAPALATSAPATPATPAPP